MIPEIFAGCTKEELKRGVRNPYYDKLVTKVEVDIGVDDIALFEEIALIHETSMRSMLMRLISDYVNLLKKGKG